MTVATGPGHGQHRGRLRTRGKLAHRRRHVGLRRQTRNQRLDLSLAPRPGLGHERLEVIGPQMRREQPCRAEVQGAVGQQVEDGGEPSTQASGLDTVVGGVLAEPQRPRAVGEERAVSLGDVELASVELGQVADQLDRGLSLPPREQNDLAKQLRVGESGRHGDQSAVHVAPSRSFRLTHSRGLAARATLSPGGRSSEVRPRAEPAGSEQEKPPPAWSGLGDEA